MFARALPHYAGHNATPCRPSYPLYLPPSKPLSFSLSFPRPLPWKSSRSREPTSRLGFLASRVQQGNTILVMRKEREGRKGERCDACGRIFFQEDMDLRGYVDFWAETTGASKYCGDFVDRWKVIRREPERKRRVIGGFCNRGE